MPELRTDSLTGRSVIVAENRAHRPNEFALTGAPLTLHDGEAASAAGRTSDHASCPFCPGNEADTPPAEYAPLDDQGRWRLRVTPNKYPAVTRDSTVAVADTSAIGFPDLTRLPAIGAHEVIIETARHIDRTSAFTVREIRDVLETYAHRLRHWRNDSRFDYGLVFKNQGPNAGASIAHLHSQLIALPDIPPEVDAELRRARDLFAEKSRCAYCNVLTIEKHHRTRIVSASDGYIAFCPYASLHPYEVWLMPDSHAASFEQSAEPDAFERLARVLQPLIERIESRVPNGCFNMLLRTAPFRAACEPWYHWRIEILPRQNSIAGFEIATGMYINPVAPEHAAARLR
jgi:UDPglucose--hexose-1-phosphate uridylyltransferase